MKSIAVLGLVGLAANVQAHPQRVLPNEVQLSKRGIDIESFRLPALSDYTESEVAQESEIVKKMAKRDTYVETATELVKSVAPDAEFRVVGDHYVGKNGIAHVNFKQTLHGVDIDNADFNVNVSPDGTIFSYGNSFFSGKVPEVSPLQKRDFNDPVVALRGAIGVLSLPVEAEEATAEAKEETEQYFIKGTSGAEQDPEARLVYFAKADGTLALTWRIETDVVDNWLLTYIDARGEHIHGVVDYVADFATYEVYPWGVNDPTEGSRVVVTDPWLIGASEFSWHGDGTNNYTVTRGNNGISQVNPSGGSAYLDNYRPTSSARNFQYPFSLTDTTPTNYRDASITQLFYTANVFHDVLYTLGFTELAGNFELNNNNQGGRGNDFVILNAQDGSGTNNANFATPVDGQNGRMRMYIWTRSTPRRDCSFEAGVVIHEYTHGLSNRLTGGPSNSGCLSTTEAGGMGEGWSDFYATAIRLKAADTRATNYPMGAWVNNGVGIRQYPYSTSLTTNPLTYRSANGQSAVHFIGTIWATILYEVMWNLIDRYGKSTATFPVFDSQGVPTDGKFLALQLVTDALALQPCSPNFVTARAAIIDADRALTGGANNCLLWTAFAKRGLGPNARYSTSSRTEDFTVPAGC
ncbi:Fungalysin metallopeptidase-domain-containing protein [Stachybotrys elegans]|uniref:Extracellular metalloproteinase n=1 Tax=Stachybotrys elegans TaxID=80388 RepID=A0A8K0WJT6_9HYPO|nr:Fungalysin metallopeptidase-domain-containing protein [Stachybotrys elegans]